MSYMYRLYNIKVVKLSVRELYMCCQTNGLWYPINPESDGQWLYNEVTRSILGRFRFFSFFLLNPFQPLHYNITVRFCLWHILSKALEFITSMGDMGLINPAYMHGPYTIVHLTHRGYNESTSHRTTASWRSSTGMTSDNPGCVDILL